MSILKGKLAYVKIGANTMIQTDNWTLNIDDGLEEVTDHGDSWVARETTIMDWNATVDMFTDWSDTAQAAIKTAVLAGSSVTLNLYESASHYWSGAAFVNISQSAPTTGIVRTTVNFNGNGAITYN
jgi:hypothetical protein